MKPTSLQIKIAVCTACFLLGGLVSRLVFEPKPEIKKEKEIVTEVQERERVVTVIKERPDGTKETTITENRDKFIETRLKEVLEKAAHKGWKVSAMASLAPKPNIYALSVERRIFGTVYGGGYVRTDKEVGLSISILF